MKLADWYQFKNPQLAETALTHRSFGTPHNQRLEWLGDAILQFEVSLLLYQQFPQLSEGGLSQLRTGLVNRDALAAIARRLMLAEHIRLGAAEMHAGRDNTKLLADMMEAYIAAIYLDGGDIRALLTTLLQEDIAILAEQIKQGGIASLSSYKTQLQELLQKYKLPPPRYTLLQQQGKDNAPTFTICCSTENEIRAEGCGKSRMAAEQEAARKCLRLLLQTQPQPQ